ncbi:hypothetical protein [Rhodococcus sp. NPDC058521]|uniref:hypothetical protein n=1 Tax=Rhodococcus sp. NPDC058521 TaxID=3346536 RepID=UPI00365DBEB1
MTTDLIAPLTFAEAMTADRGPTFDGIKIGRPATGALIDAGHSTLSDFPSDLDV